MKIVSRPDTTHRRVAAIGMFDGVHKGHLALIEYVRRQAERLRLVPSVVTFLNHPLKVIQPGKAPRRLTSNAQRVERLAAAGIRDIIMLDFNENLRRMDAEVFLWHLKEEYAVDALVVGFNNRFGFGRTGDINQYKEIGRRLGMEIIEAPEFKLDDGAKISSSRIRNLIASGDVDRAAEMLGYAPGFSGKVIAGRKLGRSLGFPTANLQPDDPNKLLPAAGVYAVDVVMPDGTKHRGVMNIGNRPTVVESEDMSIEVHIIDYEGWLYGDVLEVELLKRLRDEKHFPDLQVLKKQISDDVAVASTI